jgi:hypothetical protein
MSYVDPVEGRNALEMTDHTHDHLDHPGWVDHFPAQHGVVVGEITADWTPPVPLRVLLGLLGLDWRPSMEREDQYHVEAYELNLLRAWHVIAHNPTILQDEGFPGVPGRAAHHPRHRPADAPRWPVEGRRLG